MLEQKVVNLSYEVSLNKQNITLNNKKINDINTTLLQKKVVDIISHKPIYFATINIPKLNIREKPTLQSTIKGVGLKGETFKILETYYQKSENRIWYKIKKGWILSNYVGLILSPNLKELQYKNILNVKKITPKLIKQNQEKNVSNIITDKNISPPSQKININKNKENNISHLTLYK